MSVASADLPLFERAPALRDSIPHIPLGTFPSRVDRVELDHDGRRVEILVKRDDLIAGGYAGNKVRKLEFLLADARARGARRLVTAGAAGSHHAFATAYHGRRVGFDVSLVLFPQVLTPHVRKMLLLDAATGAELVWASRMETVPYNMWRARFVRRHEKAWAIPPGGSNDVGTLGYVNAALELAAQIERGDAPRPDSIHVAAGTLGTAAGIAIGLAWAKLDIPVRAVRITSRIITNERALASLIRSTLALLARGGATDLPDVADAMQCIELRHDHIGTGYGRPTDAGDAATATFASAGIELDPTYTAKAAAALLADTGPGRLLLFWQTLSAVEPEDTGIGAHALPAPFARYLDTGDVTAQPVVRSVTSADIDRSSE